MTCRRVIGPYAIGSGDDQHCLTIVFDQDRRRPRSLFVPNDLPTLLAGPFVEGRSEARPVVIPIDKQQVTVENGRRTLAVPVFGLHLAELLLPLQFAVHIEAVQPVRTKEREDVLAVSHRRIRRETPRVVPPFMRFLLMDGLLPEYFSVAPIDREDHELMPLRHRHTIMSPRSRTVFRRRRLTKRDRRSQKDAITPHNRRRMPLARQSDLPTNVFRLAPLDRRIGIGRRPGPQWTPPLRPISLRRTSFSGYKNYSQQQ